MNQRCSPSTRMEARELTTHIRLLISVTLYSCLHNDRPLRHFLHTQADLEVRTPKGKGSLAFLQNRAGIQILN